MNTTRTEKIGINKLEAAFNACPYLDAYIKENDKTPCWDGQVFVYNNADLRKEHLNGTVPVQVKASRKDDFGKNEISFSLNMSDIKAYFNGGGAILFVVYINNDGSEHRIYYISLLPYDLSPIVNSGKASHAFHLIPFPEGNIAEIMNIFSLFLDNRPKQMSIISNGIQTFEEMRKQGVEFDSFMFSVPNYGKRDPYDLGYFSMQPFYLYAKPKGLNIDVPIQKVENGLLSMTIPRSVTVNGIEYYPSITLIGSDGNTSVQIGQSFTVSGIKTGSNTRKISFKLRGSLKQRIKDLSFFSAILEYGSETNSGHELCYEGLDIATARGFIDKMLPYYQDVQRMLDTLGVKEDLNCDILTDNDEKNIQNFILAVLYGKHISIGQIDTEIAYGLFTIANLKIMIFCQRNDDGYYSISRFDSELHAEFIPDENSREGEHIKAPAYLVWEAEHYENACNIDFDDILQSVKCNTTSQDYCKIVNQSVLEMLKGYDNQNIKDPHLLSTAECLCKWLIEHCSGKAQTIERLNYLQTIFRHRSLNIQETGMLFDILNDPSTDDYCKVGASILLQDYEGATSRIAKLPPSEQTTYFMAQPIISLLQIAKD